MSEEELDRISVERCLNGDLDGFTALIDRYERPVFNAIYQMVRNYEDARELCQQVFMKVYESLGSYDPERKFFSWIYRIAMNESINHMKSRQEWEPLDENLPTSRANPAEELESAERSRNVQHALLGLDAKYRAVIVLRHFLHLSYREAAEVLSLPEKTVKSRLFAGRQLLKDVLESKGQGR
jgi:RNA polymerase sigma-70 factor (ECF subfamily)